MADEPRRSGRATKGQHKNASSSPAPNPKPTKAAVKSKPAAEKPKAKSKSKSKEPEPQSDEDEDGDIRCICGDTDPEDKRTFIGCDACTVWQHSVCMGVPENDADVPDHYFCEECRPEEHAETVQALENGEKIWETRNRIYQNEKKMSKNRKSKSRGDNGKPGWLKKDNFVKPAEPEAEATEDPAPAKEQTPPATNGEKETAGNKRKREDTKEEEEQPAAAEEKPARSGRQDKKRKSAAASESKAAALQDTDTALVKIENLPKDRQSVAQALNKIITADLKQRVSSGVQFPSRGTPEQFGEHHAARIEYAMHMNHTSGSPAYKQQFMALNANLKKNKILIERLMDGSLTADELSIMPSSDMASEEQQRERAAMKEALDRQAIAVQEEGPKYKQDHKGFHLIEDGAHTDGAAEAQPAAARSSVSRAQAGSPANQAPLIIDTSKQTDAAQDRRPSSQQFDMNNIWAKTAQSPTNTAGPRPAAPPVRRPSSAQTAHNNGAKDDPDIDRMLEDDDGSYSPTAGIGTDAVVWRGKLIQGQREEESPTVNARFVAGRDLASTVSWQDLLPSKLSIDGRLAVAKAEEYLCGLRWSHTSDVAVLALTPYDNAEAFNSLFDYFKSRERYAVVEKDKPSMVKDLYIIPLDNETKFPEHVEMLEHCTIKKPIEDRMLLATMVVARAPNSPPQDGTPSQQPPANGHLPPHVRNSIGGPAGSPLNTQNATFPLPQAGYGAPPSQGSIPPNPYSPQLPQQQVVYPIPGLTQPQGLQPHPNPEVTQILGNLQYTPSAQRILNEAQTVTTEQLNNLKLILEEDIVARTDFNHLTNKLFAQRSS
ncbi:histone deacetylase complex subunit cti6 [Lecanosticta acicola]|uniref:Transcription factor BYE1 n=1 Tax=Lecanosticta acicola TaxID=111012 RepID=A0AAI8YWN1_9PEZI|nr:histone deacetylase complex subunit cti6 [Lecanosticta acicola]